MKLLIQDDILNGMDVYVEYTIDTDRPGLMPEEHQIVLLDYGLELDGETVVNGANGRETVEYRTHTSLRGYINTRWMEEKLIDFIMSEETA
jgi:hypothetical protein